MPLPASLRKSDTQWRAELVARKAAGQPLGTKVTHLRAPRTRQGATLHDLYLELRKKQAARERQARLLCVGLIPSVLALVLHLNW